MQKKKEIEIDILKNNKSVEIVNSLLEMVGEEVKNDKKAKNKKLRKQAKYRVMMDHMLLEHEKKCQQIEHKDPTLFKAKKLKEALREQKKL